MIILPEDVLSDLQKSPALRKHFLTCIQGMRKDAKKIRKELEPAGAKPESTEDISSELKKIGDQLKEMNRADARRKKQKLSHPRE